MKEIVGARISPMTIRDKIREVFAAKEGKRGLRCAQVAEELPRLSKDQVKNALKQMRTRGFLGSVIDDEGKTWYFLHQERVVQNRPKEKREPRPAPDAHPLEVAMGGWR